MSPGIGVSMQSDHLQPKIAVIGLGYVGLPLAVALVHRFSVTGFDIDKKRIEELKSGFDRTHEIEESVLKTITLHCTDDLNDLHNQDVYIVTVPTPVTEENTPDLGPLQKASEMIGRYLKKNAIVVFESTVYPGVTEEFCGPILERVSGLKAGVDFYLGYSPERINPGDKVHTINRITKVVAGQTPEIAEKLKIIYGTINQDNIFVAKNIKTAEAAKVIENAQRDINIAFINEVATIAAKLDLSVYDILDAANTKWNFLPFQPGLVGGHCIGVDPYYLAHCARALQHEPEVILAGRRINESMGNFIALSVHEKLQKINPNTLSKHILILGLTFKEGIPDLRNTKVLDVINHLKKLGHTVDVHDPLADPNEAKTHLGIDLLTSFSQLKNYDCIVGTVPHQPYLQLTVEDFQKFLTPKGLIADIKNMWKRVKLPPDFTYWTL